MVVAAFIEELATLVLRHPGLRQNERLRYGHAEWQAGSTLQMQRLAHENLGFGTWTCTDEANPVTQAGDTLGVLDITCAKHARMIPPTEELRSMDLRPSRPLKARPTLRYSRLSSTEDL